MNKKALIGTTALIAAGTLAATAADAADPLRLEVRGYRNEYFIFGDTDSNSGIDFHETGHFSEGEVQFRGATTLDNGLTVGVQVELEAFAAGDQIDENYAFIEGGFGRLVLGSENTGPYQNHWSVTAPTVGAPINSGWTTAFIPAATGYGFIFRGPGGSTNLDVGNDENSITYYSPRFAGFQLSASYVPGISNTGDGFFGAVIDENTAYHDGFAIGLHYTNSFGGADVTAAIAYNRATAPEAPGGLVGAAQAAGELDDLQQVKGGLNVGFGGLSIGGSFGWEMDGRIASGGGFAVSSEGFSYDLGVSYGSGPWAIGATYFHGSVEGTLANVGGSGDEDEHSAINLGASYTLGPGITAAGGVMWAEWDTETGVAEVDNEGIVGYMGLSISY